MSQKDLQTVFDITAAALQKKGFKTAATVAMTELATHLQCDRVSVGFVHKNQSSIAALSHSSNFGSQMNLIRSIEKAMDESVDQRRTLTYPNLEEKNNSIVLAHSELSKSHGSAYIITIPFADDKSHCFGALCFERGGTQPFGQETILLCEALAALLGPILEEKRQNDQPLYAKARESATNQFQKIVGPDHLTLKFFLFLFSSLFIFFVFAQGNYRITLSSLEGTIQRGVIAPFDGYLYESFFRAGDIVEKDQILASLDTRDLTLERLQLASKQRQHVFEYDKAMAENKTSAAKIIQEQKSQAESKLALLEEQLSRARIKAPSSGLIINGDLSQSINMPIERGQILFEIAPLNSYRVKLEVDEKDIDQVTAGQQGTLVLNALPDESFPFSVNKLTPVSKSEDGRNYFMVEGVLLEQSERLRPGMGGYGKIVIERRRLIWIFTHKFVDRCRLWLWTIMP